MPEILKLYKNLGETPLECIERFRKEHSEYEKTNMTYLGRLDPMAEGLLLVLAGNTRDKKKYLEWNKTYEFEVLWGFETDTYDILGKVVKTDSSLFALNPRVAGSDTSLKLEPVLKKIKNKKTQEYPPYSSRTVGGKALFAWAREGKIHEVDIPTRSVKIFDIEHVHTRLLKQGEVLEEILKKIELVKGDFRQKEIKKLWEKSIQPEEFALISKFKIDVSSGTYIRSLAQEMGRLLDTCALAYSIKRTRVGEYRSD